MERRESFGLPEPTAPGFDTTIDSGHQIQDLTEKMPRLPTGRYRREELLGKGGMGEVYVAFDDQLERRVALKRIRADLASVPRTLARFTEEARVTAQLDHPNIVPVHDLGLDERGIPFYTMKEVQGRTLAQVLEAEDRSLPDLLRIFIKVCDAVGFAHSRGVLHRDLKPANVMVGEFGQVYVLDWGLAKQVEDASSTDALANVPGLTAAAGTPSYMAPEQAQGRLADARTDVYLLGGILYEILTRRPPHFSRFQSDSSEKPAARPAFEPAIAPSQFASVPRELEAVALKALRIVSGERYASASDLAADVEAYLDGRLVGAARYATVQRVAKWLRRHRAAVRLAAAVLVTVVAYAGWGWYEQRRERESLRADARSLAATGVLGDAARLMGGASDETWLDRSVSPEERTSSAEALARLRLLADAWSDVLRLAPDDPEARAAQFQALLALGRLALRTEDYTLAEFAFEQAGRLGYQDATARKLAADVEVHRRARLDGHLAEIRYWLDVARSGALYGIEGRGRAYDRARLRLASFREQQTVHVLVTELRALTERIRRAAEAELVSAAVPTPDEAAAGELPIEGLEEAADRYLAWVRAMGDPMLPVPTALPGAEAIGRARERLERRSARAGGELRWRDILASAQRRALHGPEGDDESVLRLAIDVLGLLSERGEPAEALLEHLWTDWDEGREMHVGIALVQLSRRDSRALLGVLAALGVWDDGARQGRWDRDEAWVQVRSELEMLVRLNPGAFRIEVIGDGTLEELRTIARLWAFLGDWRKSLDALDRGLRIAPADLALLLWKARALQGDLRSALEILDVACRVAPDDPAPFARRAEVAWELGDRTRHQADLARALELAGDDLRALAGIAACALEGGEHARAREALDRQIALDPGDAVAFARRAMVRRVQGDLAGSAEDFRRADALDARSSEVRRMHAAAAGHDGDPREAIRELSRALEDHPYDPDLLFQRGLHQGQLRLWDQAIGDFTRAIQLEPEQVEPLLQRGWAHSRRGDPKAALDDYTRAIELCPSAGRAYVARASAHAADGRYAEALEDGTRALDLDPDDARARIGRADVRRRTGDVAGAVADLQATTGRPLPDSELLASRGCVWLELGEYERASRDLEDGLRLAPGSGRLHGLRALLKRRTGDREGACADAARAIELDPLGAADALLVRGLEYLERGEHDAAIADFTEAVRIAPGRHEAFYDRANARKAGGDLPGAIVDYDRAIGLSPGCAEYHNNRGTTLQGLRELDRAAADFTRAIELSPDWPSPRYNRGTLELELGRLDDALSDFTRTTELAPELWHGWYGRGLTLAGLNRLEEAREAVQQAIDHAPPGQQPMLRRLLEKLR